MIGRIIKIVCLIGLFVLVAAVSAYFAMSLLFKSADTVVLPDFTGNHVVSVLEYLTEHGLNTKVRGSRYSAEIPKNHVIFQDPKAGTEIKKGRDVKLVLSKGTETILMPNLIGLDLRRAEIIFEENDLCRGHVSRTFNASQSKDAIVAQVPAAGKTVNRGGCIDILVSLGQPPQAYKMPDLKGLPLEEALTVIEMRRLSHGEIHTQYVSSPTRSGIVEQDPPPGYRVFERSAVHLTVKRRRPDRKTATTVADSLFRFRVENGFLKRHVRVQYTHNGFSSTLFDDFVKPGEEIWLIIPPEHDATLLVYVDDRLVQTRGYSDLAPES
jgi:serine/threonine-protein kinase